MRRLCIPFVLAFLAVVGGFDGPTVTAGTIPVNLNSWTVEGDPGNGNWNVATDGSSVLQTVNGDPTFFVSPDQFFNTTIEGTISVQTTSDNDLIGFVFGYDSITGTGDDLDYDFLLFDWKQGRQSSFGGVAEEGFSLAKVDGEAELADFWLRGESPRENQAAFQSLATSYGDDRGWEDLTEYGFSLLYQADRVKIAINGGVFNNETIFDISAADAGVSAFESGRFGFYNYSQRSVEYTSFTRESTPPPSTIPEPSTAMIFAMVAIGAIPVRSRRCN